MALEIHSLNGSEDLFELQAQTRIPDDSVITLVTPEKAWEIAEQINAARAGAKMVAIVAWRD